ncbi:uncharacterized protein BCR38DRAFT_490039 [Pseudomassariella vexata]|uniref:Uncharacterized protein n=1 Tax=Pseudomassariella vexata TaxID=1141098 RepID=A0A1Y2DEH6_9PEZI|nr:uncharacterized protein BCR38DRAFT_490039 [Pseudomassariella vexata]ORY57536.1 hypothetical protein BCR38DRAFT_490039 [Pseudomassariella vexata]
MYQDMDRFFPQQCTPTPSFSESPAPDVSSKGERKTKEEIDSAKARLSDTKFEMNHFPDPLLPRTGTAAIFMPKGVTAEMEAHLQGVIDRIKGTTAKV